MSKTCSSAQHDSSESLAANRQPQVAVQVAVCSEHLVQVQGSPKDLSRVISLG